ncbi:hypothetical protein AAMO2058_000290200 [Amorphochlora amoebiformis]
MASRRGSVPSSARTPPASSRGVDAQRRAERRRRSTRSLSPRLDKKDGKKSEAKGETVQVVCRFRPESKQERDNKGRYILELPESNDKKLSIEDEHGSLRHFKFDKVLPPFASQEETYDFVGAPIVKSVLEGYNGAIIAYGQTGSGKTHTMIGPEYEKGYRKGKERELIPIAKQAGILPRAIFNLFTQIHNIESAKDQFAVRCSYLEIYMERVRDLLKPGSVGEKGSLQISSDANRGVHLPQATEVPIESMEDALDILDLGTKHRRTARTGGNERSSRSHAIFLITVFRQTFGSTGTKVSQLYCVDLAGSEKVKKTELLKGSKEEKDKRLDEGKKINQGLLNLGIVCWALASKAKDKSVHVPYRNSKLTRLLANCIGGNARTSMIVCCSPSSFNRDETLSTLRFGQRASLIKNDPTVNRIFSVKQLKKLVDDMKQDNRRLKELLTKTQAELRIARTIQEFENSYEQPNKNPENPKSDSNAEAKRAMTPMALRDADLKKSVQQLGEQKTSKGLRRPGIRELIISFICPLSQLIIVDPVIAMDGYTYDRRAIAGYLRSNRNSPLTGEPIGRHLIPNHNLAAQIRRYYPDYKRARKLSYFRVISIQYARIYFRDLGRCASVSHEFQVLSADNSLWRFHILRSFQDVNPKVGSCGLKGYFKAKFRARWKKSNSRIGLTVNKMPSSCGVVMRPSH